MAAGENAGLRYKDKVTVITGGARGIGKGIATVFGRHGAKVVIADIIDAVATETARQLTEAGPGEATYIKCDITKPEDVKNMVEQTLAKYGQIDCLVNNAGRAFVGNIDNFDLDKLKLMLNLNTVGPYIVTQACLPHLRKVKGCIINIASISGLAGHGGGTAYAMTKAANVAFTHSLAAEEGQSGVRVNGIAPGPIRTELYGEFLKQMPARSADFFDHECNIMGRVGETEEIGLACLFLAADATFCTGVVLNCTGGIEIGYGVKSGPNHYSRF